MYYLLLAILCSALVSINMRLATGKEERNTFSMLAANYAACAALAFLYMGASNMPKWGSLGNTPILSLCMTVTYVAGLVLYQWTIRRSGVVLSAVFMKLGLLVPIASAMLLFGERPSRLQIGGFLLALLAILMMSELGKAERGKFRWELILLLLVCGSGDSMGKVFDEWGLPQFREQFLLLAFFMAAVVCIVIALVRREKTKLSDLIFGALIGLPNYLSARFSLLALQSMDAVFFYPVYSVATLFVITAVGVIAFHEKLQKRQWCAVGTIVLAIVLLSM